MKKSISQFLRLTSLVALFTLFACSEDEAGVSYEVTLNTSGTSIGEGAGTVTISVELNGDNEEGSSINIPFSVSGTAESGSDYTGLNGSVSVANGVAIASATITIIDDEDVESDETIIVTIDTGNLPENITLAGSASVTLTIIDNDDEIEEFTATASVTSNDDSGTEGSDDAAFTISLDKANSSGSPLSINYEVSGTATGGTDYTAMSGSAIIGSGNQETSVTVEITDDSDVESAETIIITLSTTQPTGISTGSSSEVTLTINDDDQATSFEMFFGNTSGNSLTIDSWTDLGADHSYVFVINTENSFTDLTDGESQYASSTYLGYGEQIIYNGSDIAGFTTTLLDGGKTYYFKAIPYTDGEVYDNDQISSSNTTGSCTFSSTTESEVCFEVNVAGDTRTISSNQYPSHDTGNFPNADPTATEITRILDLTPAIANDLTYVFDETGGPSPTNKNFYQFGMATNGVEFHPMGLKPWTHPDTQEENWEWQAQVTEEGQTDLDAYGAHVTSQGNYHYHGDITGLAVEETGNRHSLLYGFAGDGYPIYYKYGYTDPSDPASPIKELISSYQLKSGARSGSGTVGEDYPDGDHDGTYIQDFEFVENLGDLDECNGRTGVTPEFPEGTYYYIITADFPVTPNCFKGTPDEDWQIGK